MGQDAGHTTLVQTIWIQAGGGHPMLERLYLYLKLKPLGYLGRLRRWVIGSHATAVLADSWNGLLLAPITDLYIGRKLSQRGFFDKEMVEQLSALVDRDSDVLFVGAHIGALLVPIARECRSVVGIEANPGTFQLLKLNVLLNELKNVELFNLAAFDQAGKVRFVANKVNTGGSKIFSGIADRFEFHYDNPDIVEVRAARLDDVLNGRPFDLIVLDVEGSEYRALKGMPDTLATAGQLIIEIAPNLVDNVAGISKEEFLDAIPPRFTVAMLLGDKKSYSRSELVDVCDKAWKNDYYGSPNLSFMPE